MKKTQKKILGFVGLLFVAAMTVFAAFLPGPGALATTSSVTDTIVVRVVATTPNVTITNPENGKVFVKSKQTITYTYENVQTAVVTLEYRDKDGNVRIETLETIHSDGSPGSGSYDLDLYNDYGFGDFIVKVVGTAPDGVSDEDVVAFAFVPVTGEASQIKNTGKVKVDLDYDENNEDIEFIEINIYDEKGNLIKPLSPVKVNKPDKSVTLPFDEHNLPSGKYTFEISAIGKDGKPLQPPYITSLDYVAPSDDPDIPVPGTGGGDSPNTGGLFSGLNISRADYLITGLIVFLLVGICGIVIVGKKSENKRK